MKDELNNWKNSKKFQELQQQLNKRKEQILKLQAQMAKKNNNKKNWLSDSELEQQCDLIIAYHNLPDEAKEDGDFFIEVSVNKYTKKELYFNFIQKLAAWYYHLSEQVKKENYELCSKINQVIHIETTLFFQQIIHHLEYDATAEEEYVAEIHQHLKKEFGI